MALRSSFLLVLAVVAALAVVGSATAQPSASVIVDSKGEARSDGSAVVRVQVTCTGTVLEANVSLSQNGTSGMGGIGGIACDGRPHNHDVRIVAFDGAFRKGSAQASAFVLVCNNESCSETAQEQHSRGVKLKRKPL